MGDRSIELLLVCVPLGVIGPFLCIMAEFLGVCAGVWLFALAGVLTVRGDGEDWSIWDEKRTRELDGVSTTPFSSV